MDNVDAPLRMTLLVKAAELTQRAATAPILVKTGLSYAQFSMLLMIARVPGMSGAALARMHGITAQSAGELIAALAKRDLLERRQGKANGRIMNAYLTATGAALVHEAEPDLQSIDSALSAGISVADLKTARRVLTRIVTNGNFVPIA